MMGAGVIVQQQGCLKFHRVMLLSISLNFYYSHHIAYHIHNSANKYLHTWLK